MVEVGIRVIRGPDWKWGAQDDGEGHVGTVVEVGRFGSLTSPEKTVVVQWDYGYRTNYRVGYQDGYDLLVVDNAPAGVKHPNIICDGCQKMGIAGMRWKCTHCYDYDLCTSCYMADNHDLSHVFQRFETASALGVEMPPRRNGNKVMLKGIFVGSKVVRGGDWDWGNQDGGEGKTGRVIDIRGWDNESSRSVANVTWTSGSTNVYRLGHKGKVDLRYVQDAAGGYHYRDHLPLLGKEAEAPPNKQLCSPRHLTFNVGDKVKVLMEVENLKQMQEGHGGWNPKMAEYIGQIGTVHRVTDRGDIRVQYEGCSHRWTFHPGSLTKVNTLAVGDIVRIHTDMNHVKEQQKGHGEWIDVMREILGKVGKVIKIYCDGDLRVCAEGQTWTFNPLCVSLVPGSATELNNTLQSDEGEKRPDPVDSLLPSLVDEQVDSTSIDSLVHKAAEGHFTFVREFINKFPNKVNDTSSGKTCLQVAAHEGHLELVHMLLGACAELEIADEVGDTALHYSAFGNQKEVMELLILKGANVNSVNSNNCTTLHVAVNKQHVACVRMLLKYHCNVNIQDSWGDTPLHDAIGKDNLEIVELLCSVPGVDFTLRNKRGFNVLHHAALKGNNYATEKLLARTRQLVDVKKDDGFAALHLASLNGHKTITETLLVQGQADINLRNNRRQSALLLAMSQNHFGVVELLLQLGADTDTADDYGDTALHLATLKMLSFATMNEPTEHETPMMFEVLNNLRRNHPFLPSKLLGVCAVACFLIQEGCSVLKKNRKNKTPLEILSEDEPFTEKLVQIMMKYNVEKRPRTRHLPAFMPMDKSQPGLTLALPPPLSATVRTECTVCSESGQNVCFEPCGDRVACEECAIRMKRCIICHQIITKKTTKDGRLLLCKERQSSAERLKYLENKIAEIEETHGCSICMERRRNVVFLCGHGACENCAQPLKTCHMCRKAISKKINLY